MKLEIDLNIRDHCHKKHKHVEFLFAFGLPQLKDKTMPAEVTITTEQKVNVVLKPVTATGKPALLDGAPKWSVVSGNGTVVVAPDGLSADLVSSDTPGDTTYLIDGDADLGAGVIDLQDTVLCHVLGANAANLGVTVGVPVPK